MSDFPNADEEIVLYHRKPNGGSKLGVITGRELKIETQKYTNWLLFRKPIPLGATAIDIISSDLWTPQQKEEFKRMPNSCDSELNIANVRLPASVVAKRVLGKFKELYILREFGKK